MILTVDPMGSMDRLTKMEDEAQSISDMMLKHLVLIHDHSCGPFAVCHVASDRKSQYIGLPDLIRHLGQRKQPHW